MKPYISFREKVSDVDNVRNRSIEEFRKQIKDKNFIRKLRYGDNIKYSIYLYKDKLDKQNIKITFHFGKYKNSKFQDTYKNRWDIFIKSDNLIDLITYDKKRDIVNYDKFIEELEDLIVHEISHASQMINGSINYLRKSNFWDTAIAKSDEKKYGIHSTKPTEQEAVFIEFLFNIQNKRFENAYDKLQYWSSYFRNFTFKDFIKKAYSIGIDKNLILQFQKFAINKFKKNAIILDSFDEKEILENNTDIWLIFIIKQKYLTILKILLSENEYKNKIIEFKNFIQKVIKKYPNVKKNEKYNQTIEHLNKIK